MCFAHVKISRPFRIFTNDMARFTRHVKLGPYQLRYLKNHCAHTDKRNNTLYDIYRVYCIYVAKRYVNFWSTMCNFYMYRNLNLWRLYGINRCNQVLGNIVFARLAIYDRPCVVFNVSWPWMIFVMIQMINIGRSCSILSAVIFNHILNLRIVFDHFSYWFVIV